MHNYILLVFAWAAYCAVHSTLISLPVTGFMERLLGPAYRFYRLSFNLFSILTLIPLVFYSNSARWETAPLLVWQGQLRYARWLLIGLAAALAVAGARHYSMPRFLGIEQIRNAGSRGALTESGKFDSSGVLGIVRHPWYVAVFLALWASDLNAAGITVAAVLSAYLVVGTLLEERKLLLEFGDEYRKYQERVSMFVPLKWVRRRSRAAAHS